ncbi:response regulator transcription factor [Streptococcus plurextorum]|uniref:response regulator transcription factor n=1 Tax=Streptococcus plurextorum TaxID=456876 RepID=UPI0004177DF3|nr:response regulator transcription factor [Streptococcus plurextorum]
MIDVMIAEDMPFILEDLAEAIDQHPSFQVTGRAKTGEGIIDLVKHNPPDLVLMDIEMESMNAGILATEAIGDLGLKTQVIYLTAHESRKTILTAMATPAVDYIVKGVDYEKIFQHMEAVVEGHPLMEGVAQEVLIQEYKRLQKSEKSLLFFITNLSRLTASEREIIKLLLEDCKISEMARLRYVEPVTIKTQMTSILKKFGVRRSKEVVQTIRDLNLEHLF